VEFGRIGQIALRKKIHGKWKEKSYRAIMVGYAKNHSADTYRLYNPVKRSIIENRDVTWLDWTRLNPARNLSIFATEPDLLTNLGIDDEEMPVTDIDDRALHIVPEDDDSVAGRLVPREARFQAQNDENEDAPAIIEDPIANREEEDEEARADAEAKAHRLENEMRNRYLVQPGFKADNG
jgi:hypothetical protein